MFLAMVFMMVLVLVSGSEDACEDGDRDGDDAEIVFLTQVGRRPFILDPLNC